VIKIILDFDLLLLDIDLGSFLELFA